MKFINRKIVKIFCAFILSVVCSFSMFLSFDSYAFTQQSRDYFSIYNIYERVEGNVNESSIKTVRYSENLSLSSYLTQGHNYAIYLYLPIGLNSDFRYVDSDKDKIYTSMSMSYAGSEYVLSKPSTIIYVEGNGDNQLNLNFKHDILLNPYAPGDGYIYQNSCQLELVVDNAFCGLYSLNDQDIPLFERLSEMISLLTNISGSNSTIANDMSYILEKMHAIMLDTDDIRSKVVSMETLLIECRNILLKVPIELDEVNQHLIDIETLLKEQGSDKDKTDDFASDSDTQSDKLNGLNEQNKMDKIDVDSASSSVDANIDGNAISNYGVVLSSITGQGKVVQLMLIVLSVGLVSYVLFGKR